MIARRLATLHRLTAPGPSWTTEDAAELQRAYALRRPVKALQARKQAAKTAELRSDVARARGWRGTAR